MNALLATLLGILAAGGDPPKSRHEAVAIDLFAAEPNIVTPVGIAVDDLGRVLAVESNTHFRPANYPGPAADRIRVFEDRDHDGKAEVVSDFFTGAKHTMGLGFHPDGTLLVATRSEVFRLRDANHDARADGPPEPLLKLETEGDYPHNGLSGFAFDAAGNVYVGLGENLGASYRLVDKDGRAIAGGGEGGSIFRCRPDGTGLERYATGFWNPFHMAFDAFGRLLAVDNDPDSRPPCRLLDVVSEGDYGYRFRNGRKGLHPFTSWNGELPGTLPMIAGTGEAPSGVLVVESDQFPSEFRGDLLVTSWGDHRIDRFRLAPDGASVKATVEPLITGGADFRPVGLAVAPDGSVYATDWVDRSYTLHGKGRIWRLRAVKPNPRVRPASDVDALAHPDRAIRERAARRLAADGGSGRDVLRKALTAHADARARASALDALALEPAPADDAALRASLDDHSAAVRAQAVRRLPARLVDPRIPAMLDASTPTWVRAEALRRLADRADLSAALVALDGADPFLGQAARVGIRRLLDREGLVYLYRGQNGNRRAAALLMLRESGGPTPVEIVKAALDDPDSAVRFLAIEWVGEERLETFRPRLLEGLEGVSRDRRLFSASLAALERLEGKARTPTNEQGGEGYIATLLNNPAVSPVVQRRALLSLRPENPLLSIARLQPIVEEGEPADRLLAIRLMSQSRDPARIELLTWVAIDLPRPLDQRAEAVLGLASSDVSKTETLALLLALAHLNEPIMRREALRALRGTKLGAAYHQDLRRVLAGDPEALELFRMLEPREPRPAEVAGTLATWLARLEGPADPAAGQRVFFHPNGPGCYRCHQVDGFGGGIGPDLGATGSNLSRERLVESILQPDKEVAPQFVAHAVALADGRVLTGMLVSATENERVYADSQGVRHTLKTGEIDDVRPLTTSIMPAELPNLMTLQEFRDLVAFLRQGSTTPVPRGTP